MSFFVFPLLKINGTAEDNDVPFNDNFLPYMRTVHIKKTGENT